MEKPVILSVEMEHKAYWDLKFLNFDESLFGDKRNLQLHELEDMRLNPMGQLSWWTLLPMNQSRVGLLMVRG